MSERDELALIIGEQFEHQSPQDECRTCPDVQRAADAVLAAGYTKPRQVTTVEELDALPVGTVVRTTGTEDEDPRVACKADDDDWYLATWSEYGVTADELDDLPATVLYSPAAIS